MKHLFIINTEDVNEYGYRVLTSGIDYTQYMRNPIVLFMHQRAERGNEVIGRCTRLYKEGTILIAEVEFDTEDDFAKQIAGKVERGFIRMASMYADVKATSSQEQDLLQGQTYETVTACKLVEISIVDIGGNDNALRLAKDGKPYGLKKLVTQTNTNMDIKVIALALGMPEGTKEEAVLSQVQALRLAKETAEQKLASFEQKQAQAQKAEATALVEKAIQLGLFPEPLKESQEKLFETDFDQQKAILSKLISEKEAEHTRQGQADAVRNVVLGAGSKPNSTTEHSFDYLQKYNPEKLRALRDTEPDTYARLAKEYAQGVRYVKK